MTLETQSPASKFPLVVPTRSETPTARLILRNDLGQVIQQWLVRQNKCTLGSAASCALRCNIPGIAPYHALLVVGARQTFIRALAPKLTRDGVPVNEALLTAENNFFEIAGHRFELTADVRQSDESVQEERQDRLKFTLARPLELKNAPAARVAPPSANEKAAFTEEIDAPVGQTFIEEVVATNDRLDSRWIAKLVQSAVEPLECQIQNVLLPIAQLQAEAQEQRALLEEQQERMSAESFIDSEQLQSREKDELEEKLQEFAARQSAALDTLTERVSDVNQQLSAIEQIVSAEPETSSAVEASDAANDNHEQVEAIHQLQNGMVNVSNALKDLEERQSQSRADDQSWRTQIQEQVSTLKSSIDSLASQTEQSIESLAQRTEANFAARSEEEQTAWRTEIQAQFAELRNSVNSAAAMSFAAQPVAPQTESAGADASEADVIETEQGESAFDLSAEAEQDSAGTNLDQESELRNAITVDFDPSTLKSPEFDSPKALLSDEASPEDAAALDDSSISDEFPDIASPASESPTWEEASDDEDAGDVVAEDNISEEVTSEEVTSEEVTAGDIAVTEFVSEQLTPDDAVVDSLTDEQPEVLGAEAGLAFDSDAETDDAVANESDALEAEANVFDADTLKDDTPSDVASDNETPEDESMIAVIDDSDSESPITVTDFVSGSETLSASALFERQQEEISGESNESDDSWTQPNEAAAQTQEDEFFGFGADEAASVSVEEAIGDRDTADAIVPETDIAAESEVVGGADIAETDNAPEADFSEAENAHAENTETENPETDGPPVNFEEAANFEESAAEEDEFYGLGSQTEAPLANDTVVNSDAPAEAFLDLASTDETLQSIEDGVAAAAADDYAAEQRTESETHVSDESEPEAELDAQEEEQEFETGGYIGATEYPTEDESSEAASEDSFATYEAAPDAELVDSEEASADTNEEDASSDAYEAPKSEALPSWWTDDESSLDRSTTDPSYDSHDLAAEADSFAANAYDASIADGVSDEASQDIGYTDAAAEPQDGYGAPEYLSNSSEYDEAVLVDEDSSRHAEGEAEAKVEAEAGLEADSEVADAELADGSEESSEQDYFHSMGSEESIEDFAADAEKAEDLSSRSESEIRQALSSMQDESLPSIQDEALSTFQNAEQFEHAERRAEIEKANANVTPSGDVDESDGEESVEDYMNRLLNRMRGNPDAAPEPAKPQAPPKSETHSRIAELHKENLESMEGPDATQPPKAEKPFNPDEFVPRVSAPEKVQNLAAMRELANTTARSAIHKSSRERDVRGILFEAAVAFITFVVGGALLSVNGFALNFAFVTAMTCFAFAFIWGIRSLLRLGPVLQSNFVLHPNSDSTDGTNEQDAEAANVAEVNVAEVNTASLQANKE